MNSNDMEWLNSFRKEIYVEFDQCGNDRQKLEKVASTLDVIDHIINHFKAKYNLK